MLDFGWRCTIICGRGFFFAITLFHFITFSGEEMLSTSEVSFGFLGFLGITATIIQINLPEYSQRQLNSDHCQELGI